MVTKIVVLLLQEPADFINLTIDGLTVSTTVSTDATSAATLSEGDHIVARLVREWNAQYGTASAASASYSLFTVTSGTGQINISAKTGSGRRGFDKAYSIAIVPATTTGASATLLAEYGATSAGTDNNTISGGIIVTLESNIGGVLLDAVQGSVASGTTASVTQLTTTQQIVGNVRTTTTANIYPDEARGDTNKPEANVVEVATAATSTDRTAWLN